jgi:hypothetical protein
MAMGFSKCGYNRNLGKIDTFMKLLKSIARGLSLNFDYWWELLNLKQLQVPFSGRMAKTLAEI